MEMIEILLATHTSRSSESAERLKSYHVGVSTLILNTKTRDFGHLGRWSLEFSVDALNDIFEWLDTKDERTYAFKTETETTSHNGYTGSKHHKTIKYLLKLSENDATFFKVKWYKV